jgi:hypothetical protein
MLEGSSLFFEMIIKLTYLPPFSAFVSNLWHFQPFSAVSAIFSFLLIIGKRVRVT